MQTERDDLDKLRHSKEVEGQREILIRRAKLERRVQKWQALIHDSKESLQSLEAISARNYKKRQALSSTLDKYQREKTAREEDFVELERYCALLAALLSQDKEL